MTPKERVRAAIEHREPDIVPVAEWIVDYEPAQLVLGRPTYLRGKARLAHALWAGKRDEIVESMKRDEVELIRRLDLDMVCADLVWHRDVKYTAPEQVDEKTWRDRHGNVFRYSDLTRDLMLLEAGDKGYEAEYPGDSDGQPDPSELELIEYAMAEFGQTHFMFTGMGRAHLPIFTALWVERDLIRLADEDPDKLAAERVEWAEYSATRMPYFKKLGFDAILGGEDYGFNSGPFMSPETFRRVHFPALKRICEAAHENGLFYICHSCGNLRPILPLMIEAGIDVYQAIQPIEDIAGLKRDFGRDVCLWGGVSNHDLVLAEPDEIRAQVKQSISACAPGGGFILGSSHSITVQTPLENILAYLEAAGRHPQPAPAPAPSN
jgi:uroporphyrinogen decarboxylase